MSEHFVETQGLQPELFVFKQYFVCDDNYDYHIFVSNLDNNYTKLQDQHFLNYWEKARERLLLEQYNLMQKSSEAAEKEILDQEDVVSDVAQVSITEVSATLSCDESTLENNSDEWTLWWQEYADILKHEKYNIFVAVYYNYYLTLKSSLLAEFESACEEEVSPAYETDSEIVTDLLQLQLLGLPTTFGSRSQQTFKKKEIQSEAACAPFYSDEEEDADSMDSLDNNGCKASIIDQNDTEDVSLYGLKTPSINKKKKKNRKLRNVPSFLREERGMLKYWRKRFSLFSRYDEGIRLDRESWFSVTPEKVAIHIAERLACDVIIDAFCGCGGNAIQFAQTCGRVIAIDIDPSKVQMARHNATVYGVADKIDFIVGDFLQLGMSGQLRGDVIFLSPPWGGPKYKQKENYDIERYLQPVSATDLMRISQNICANVALYLPRNVYMQQIIKLAGVGKRCEVEHNYLDSRLVAITALYGEEILSKKLPDDGVENTKHLTKL